MEAAKVPVAETVKVTVLVDKISSSSTSYIIFYYIVLEKIKIQKEKKNRKYL